MPRCKHEFPPQAEDRESAQTITQSLTTRTFDSVCAKSSKVLCDRARDEGSMIFVFRTLHLGHTCSRVSPFSCATSLNPNMPIMPSFNEASESDNGGWYGGPSFSGPQSSFDSSSSLVMELEALHADEFAYLSQKLTNVERRCKRSFVFSALVMVQRYLNFVFMTWVKALWAFVFFPTSTLFPLLYRC